MQVVTRRDAKARGLKRYFTGKACHRGHLEERLVSNCRCYACALEDAHRYFAESPAKIRGQQRASYLRDPAQRHHNARRWKDRNPQNAVKHEDARNRRDPFRSHQRGGV